MSIEEDIFKKTTIHFEKILEYGFQYEDGKYIYSKYILGDSFQVRIEIDESKNIKGKIIDLSFNEEYLNFRINDFKGEFVNKIRNEFINILEDIKNTCCSKKYFIFPQSNRITDLIIDQYNTFPEFLWEKHEGYGVFRKINQGKWYAIIMNIPRNKIDQGTEEIEIINVKLKEDKIIDLLSKKGYYKAYHMNKKNWISIPLDDTLEDENILSLIK